MGGWMWMDGCACVRVSACVHAHVCLYMRVRICMRALMRMVYIDDSVCVCLLCSMCCVLGCARAVLRVYVRVMNGCLVYVLCFVNGQI